MKKNIQLCAAAMLATTAILFSGCGGGSPQQREMSQIERANVFAKELNYVETKNGERRYSSQYVLAKGVSLDPNQRFAVVLDTVNNKYFSVDMSNYSGYVDAKSHLQSETINGRAYYNLVTGLDGSFQFYNSDGSKGPKFSKDEVTDVTATVSPAAIAKDILSAKAAVLDANLNGLGIANSAKAAELLAPILADGVITESERPTLDNALVEVTGSGLEALTKAVEGSQADQLEVAAVAIKNGAITAGSALNVIDGITTIIDSMSK